MFTLVLVSLISIAFIHLYKYEEKTSQIEIERKRETKK